MINRKLFFAVALLVSARAFANESEASNAAAEQVAPSRCERTTAAVTYLFKKNALTAVAATAAACALTNDTATRLSIVGTALVANTLRTDVQVHQKCSYIQETKVTQAAVLAAVAAGVVRLYSGNAALPVVVKSVKACRNK